MPNADAPRLRVIRTWVPKVARMATTIPTTLWPVPARMVRSSPNRSAGMIASRAAFRAPFFFGGSLLEVAKSAQVLLDLGGLGVVEPGVVDLRGGCGGGRRRGGGRGLPADHRRQHLSVVLHGRRHLQRGQHGRRDVDEPRGIG